MFKKDKISTGMRGITLSFLTAVILLHGLNSCRKEEAPLALERIPVTEGLADAAGNLTTGVKGFYLLNEGNMGSNKASLDYFDYGTGCYYRNIYADLNPKVTMGLGDVGNDLQIWDDRLYAVINCSNLVEVMEARSGRHVGRVSIPNCRYIAFYGDFAYVSSYAGPVGADPEARPGKIVKVDLKTLKIVEECTVGYQPEQLVISGSGKEARLFVANSGGYRAPDYDRRISIIDLDKFQVTGELEVGINPQKLLLTPQGEIIVATGGNYQDLPAETWIIRPDGSVKQLEGISISGMALRGKELCCYSKDWTRANEAVFFCLDTESWTVTDRQLIKDGSEKKIRMPYALAVNPASGEFLVCDARDFMTPGKLYCYSPEGRLEWSVTTGDIPGHLAFTAQDVRLE